VNHLGLGPVHVVGQSMGGMIAQLVSISHPEVTLSLTSVYSAPSRSYLVMDGSIREQRDQGPAASFEEAVEQFMVREKISGLDGFDDAGIRAYAEKVISRDYKREAAHHGRTAHMRATMKAPDRTEGLRQLAIPAAVIHGRSDPLISFAGGVATASAIPDAELHVFAGMKHQLRADLWPDYVRIIQRTAQRAQV
jgi:pimeloyl-ACP methyl ester carboxylesterase